MVEHRHSASSERKRGSACGRQQGRRIRNAQGNAAREARSGPREVRRAMARCLQPTPGHGGVIMESREFVLQARIDAEVLDEWVHAGWLTPRRNGANPRFSEA